MRPACEVIGDVNDAMRCWEFQWLDTCKKVGCCYSRATLRACWALGE